MTRSLEEILATAPRNGDDPLLMPAVAARMIGVSPETVRRWIRNNDISYEHIGPHRKMLRSSVVVKLSPRCSTRNIPAHDARTTQDAHVSE